MNKTSAQFNRILSGGVIALLISLFNTHVVLACPESKNGLDHIQDLSIL